MSVKSRRDKIARSQYSNRGFMHPKTLMKLGTQLALMLLATFSLLVQLDRSIDYSSVYGVGSSYTTFSPGYTDEPIIEEVDGSVKPAPGGNIKSRPLFGFIPVYVAAMSSVILVIVFSGFVILYLYNTGQLR